MCGRYTSARKQQELLGHFQALRDVSDAALEPDYNVAPTKPVPAILTRRPHGADESAVAERQLRTLRWGLVPSWAKDVSVGSRLINARLETVHEKPSFRGAFARRRCLLPADGYYEWYATEDAAGKPRKQPFFIRPSDGGVLAMAGLYELWRDPARSDDDPLRWLWTSTIITTQAIDDVGRIHDRMPMLVEPECWEAWLDPDYVDPPKIKDLLVPAAAGQLSAYPVSNLVNNHRNNGPELIEPLPQEGFSGEYAPTLF